MEELKRQDKYIKMLHQMRLGKLLGMDIIDEIVKDLDLAFHQGQIDAFNQQLKTPDPANTYLIGMLDNAKAQGVEEGRKAQLKEDIEDAELYGDSVKSVIAIQKTKLKSLESKH